MGEINREEGTVENTRLEKRSGKNWIHANAHRRSNATQKRYALIFRRCRGLPASVLIVASSFLPCQHSTPSVCPAAAGPLLFLLLLFPHPCAHHPHPHTHSHTRTHTHARTHARTLLPHSIIAPYASPHHFFASTRSRFRQNVALPLARERLPDTAALCALTRNHPHLRQNGR